MTVGLGGHLRAVLGVQDALVSFTWGCGEASWLRQKGVGLGDDGTEWLCSAVFPTGCKVGEAARA